MAAFRVLHAGKAIFEEVERQNRFAEKYQRLRHRHPGIPVMVV